MLGEDLDGLCLKQTKAVIALSQDLQQSHAIFSRCQPIALQHLNVNLFKFLSFVIVGFLLFPFYGSRLFFRTILINFLKVIISSNHLFLDFFKNLVSCSWLLRGILIKERLLEVGAILRNFLHSLLQI